MPALSAISQKGSPATGTDKIVMPEGLYVPASEIAALATATTASYDNATSGLTATDVQAAIDEIAGGGGGGGSVAGSDKQIQFNDGGALGAEAGFEYDKTTDTLTVPKATLSGLLNLAKGSNIASASTTDIAAATANYVHITGTTTITALGTAQAGAQRVLVFDGALTLTHNATSLILPTGANIATAAGDTALMVSEGSGNWRCVAYLKKDGSALAGGGGSLTGFTASLETASPNNFVNVSLLLASGGSTDQNAVLQAKGTGGVGAKVADGTVAGGNVRGARSVDWQHSRNGATQVASGADSVIGGGLQNTASGVQATVAGGRTNSATSSNATVGGGSGNQATQPYSTVSGGSSNTASGAQGSAVGGGENNTASALRAKVAGGYLNTADGDYSWVPGGYWADTRGIYGAGARASGGFSASGDTQSRCFVMRQVSSSATPVVLTTNAAAGGTANQPVLPNNSSFIVKGVVNARQASTGDAKSWEFTAHIKRGANAAATAMVAAASVTSIAADAGAAAWAVAVTANTTTGCLSITATGEASKTIKWVADIYSSCELVG